jgi:hypothetical protein
MHPHATNPAAQPHLSLSLFSAPIASREGRKRGGERPFLSGAIASTCELGFGRASAAEKGRGDLVQRVSSASYPVLCSGSRFGPFLRPAAGSLFCFAFRALRVTVSVCDGPSVNAELRPWEQGPLAGIRQG